MLVRFACLDPFMHISPTYTQKILIIIIATPFRSDGIRVHLLAFMSSFGGQLLESQRRYLKRTPACDKRDTARRGNAISLTILRWHQVQTPHRATSQTAHTRDATDTRNTLRDTEPEERDTQRAALVRIHTKHRTTPHLGAYIGVINSSSL